MRNSEIMNEADTRVASLEACIEKMQAHGVPPLAITAFARNYSRLVGGEMGLLAETEIDPIMDLSGLPSFVGGTLAGPESPELARAEGEARRRTDASVRRPELADQCVVVKLNGGLGTTMGLSQAKSLLEVKSGLSFLDIIVRQVLSLREEYEIRLPLILMNSFRTHHDSETLLQKYPELVAKMDLPLGIVQHRVPKIDVTDLSPIDWPKDRELEWCPPGHGDLYTSLVTSGLLDLLLAAGYKYAFVSNADNLAAVFDPHILEYMHHESIPYLMEVTDRTPLDRKGGHVATLKDGHLTLRELAQVPPGDAEAFEDIGRHRLFNTNNIWIDVSELKKLLETHENVLPLPFIKNTKTVDPSDPNSPQVYQLETAVGSAIRLFDNAAVLRVTRDRFLPVKNASDLAALRSTNYSLGENFTLGTK